jgi:hypothetical protein
MPAEKKAQSGERANDGNHKVDVASLKRATAHLGSLAPRLSEISARRSSSKKG